MGLLALFVVLQTGQCILEFWLARINKNWYLNPSHQESTCRALAITEGDFQKTLAYTLDKDRFSEISSTVRTVGFLMFLSLGGFGLIEGQALRLSTLTGSGVIGTGLFFFAITGLLSALCSLPFGYYFNFYIEDRHGFNRQTRTAFFKDATKGLIVGALMGGLLLSGLLWLMELSGPWWWLMAWAFITFFQLLTVLIYPSLLAPIFNKFSPLDEGDLKEAILKLTRKVGFHASGISIMDASIRSSHGNAFFTGIFSKKRIVLFDTLIEALSVKEIVAVLGHELGHFRLHHVRQSLIRSTLFMGGGFYLLSILLPIEEFYMAFGLRGASSWGALFVFSLWFGILDFFIAPVQSFLSRKNEFAADAFAREQTGSATDLAEALKKLRQQNHAMPVSHPLYSAVYHSHPPLAERIDALLQSPGS